MMHDAMKCLPAIFTKKILKAIKVEQYIQGAKFFMLECKNLTILAFAEMSRVFLKQFNKGLRKQERKPFV